MSKSSANAEPSMEEILASIRQIISDDEPEQPADDESPEEEADAEPELESAADEVISESDLDALFADPAPAEPEPEPEEEPSDDLDDGFASVAADPEPESEPEPEMELEEDDDVLDLASMAEPSADMSDEPFDPPEDLDFAEPEPEPELDSIPEPVTAAPEPVMHEPLAPAAPLLSQQTDSAVSSAFADLASTMLSGNARTLEDLVQDMLRPMLKSWLDENLPTMVEKMVREEIERVARRGPRP